VYTHLGNTHTLIIKKLWKALHERKTKLESKHCDLRAKIHGDINAEELRANHDEQAKLMRRIHAIENAISALRNVELLEENNDRYVKLLEENND
jgi:hypothetical protein